MSGRRRRRGTSARPRALAAFGSEMTPEDRRAFAEEEGIGIGEVRLPIEEWLKEAMESMGEFKMGIQRGTEDGSIWIHLDPNGSKGWRLAGDESGHCMKLSCWTEGCKSISCAVLESRFDSVFECLRKKDIRPTTKLLWSVYACQVTLHSDMADDVMQKFGHVPQQALDLVVL